MNKKKGVCNHSPNPVKINNMNLMIITYKDVMQKLQVSKTTAKSILTDIRKELNIKRVTMQHLQNYLKLN